MPITDDLRIEYNIPKDIKIYFIKGFLQIFQEKLLEIFPKAKGKTYYEAYLWLESTGGWGEAFQYTCEEFGCVELGCAEFISEYYENLEWYDKDLFDSEFGELLVEYGLVELGEPDTYEDELVEGEGRIVNVDDYE